MINIHSTANNNTHTNMMISPRPTSRTNRLSTTTKQHAKLAGKQHIIERVGGIKQDRRRKSSLKKQGANTKKDRRVRNADTTKRVRFDPRVMVKEIPCIHRYVYYEKVPQSPTHERTFASIIDGKRRKISSLISRKQRAAPGA